MDNKLNIIDNTTENRFEATVGNDLAFIDCRWQHGNLALMHTEVPEKFEGKGYASQLAKFAFNYAKQHNTKVLVYCPYISTFIKRHKEYNELIEKDYNT